MKPEDDRIQRTAAANESRTLATDEEKAALEAAKAELKARFDKGEINGIQYNRELVALTVPEEKTEKPRPTSRKKSLIILIVFIVLLSIPAMVYLYARFSFQNSLTAEGIANYYDKYSPSLDREPIQIEVGGTENGTYKGREIGVTYKYYYDITAVVASVRDYWGLGDYDTLVPRDVCLVWGGLIEPLNSGKASFTQSGRFCNPVIDGQEYSNLDIAEVRGVFGNKMLALHEFSNNHVIPSSTEVRGKIFGLNKGDKVRLSGYLVTVRYGGIQLSSSTTRNDFGDGACEVFYVTKVDNL